MEFLSLQEFEDKWHHRIKEFISITVNGKESNIFDFEDNSNEDKSYEELVKEKELELENEKNSEDSIDKRDEMLKSFIDREDDAKLEYYGTDKIKDLSDEILSVDDEPEILDDINLFSCNNYGYDLKIDSTKVNQSDLIQFFQDFSLINLNSFKDSEEAKSLPESAYIRELFSISNNSRVKDYVFYMLRFKVNCVEYKVMKDFLMMCYILKIISGRSSSGLSLSIRKLKIDYSMLYLRIGMLFPRSGV